MKQYNLNFSFNKWLREVPENPEDMANYICDEEEKLDEVEDPKILATVLGEIGAYARIVGDLESADEFLAEAMELIEEHDLGHKLWALNGVRMAHVYHWAEEYEMAEELLENILEACDFVPELSDFKHAVLQHLGKLYFDLEEYEMALECFKEALDLRKILKNEELINSTEYAISRVSSYITR